MKPPVGNKLLFEEDGMIAKIIGGPNTRVDFYDDPVQEFFYQIKDDMFLKVVDDGTIKDVRINEGVCSCCRPTCAIRHNTRWRGPTG